VLVAHHSKVWDTYSGDMLHSFTHNHIVRTVALDPSASHLLTAGDEKKMRLFDLNRPDALPSFMKRGSNEAHDKSLRSYRPLRYRRCGSPDKVNGAFCATIKADRVRWEIRIVHSLFARRRTDAHSYTTVYHLVGQFAPHAV